MQHITVLMMMQCQTPLLKFCAGLFLDPLIDPGLVGTELLAYGVKVEVENLRDETGNFSVLTVAGELIGLGTVAIESHICATMGVS